MRVGLAEFLLTRRSLVAALAIALTIVAVRAYVGLGLENRVDAFFDADDPSYVRYQLTRDLFQKQAFLFVVVRADRGVFRADALERIAAISDAADALPEVHRVFSLTTTEDITGTADGVEVAPIVSVDSLGATDLEALRERILGDPFFPGLIVSHDGKTTVVASELRDGAAPTNTAAVAGLEAAMVAASAPGLEMHLAGWPAVTTLLNALTEQDVRRGLPFMMGMLFVALCAAFRRVGPVVIIAVGVVFVITWTMGSFAGAGFTGTFLTVSALPAILLALTLATGVHVVVRVQQERALTPDLRTAITNAVEHVAPPVGVSCLTTAIGFGSLGVSTLPPVRHLGAFAALGTVYIAIVCLTVLPLGLMSAPPRAQRAGAPGASGPFGWIAGITVRHSRTILGATVAVAVVAAAGLLHLQPQSTGLSYLPEDSPPMTAMRFIEAHFGGATDIEVLVETSDKALLRHDVATLVADIQDIVLRHEDTTAATSYVDLVRRMHRALADGADEQYRLPEAENAIAQELFLYETSGGEELATWIDPATYGVAHVRGHTTSFQPIARMHEYYGTIERELAEVAARAPVPFELTITGDGPLWYRVNTSLLVTMGKSFLVALVGVALMMLLVTRSLRLGLIAMVPNLLPVLIAVGGMGWAGVQLDFATVMVAGITLGIAVDDTVHYLYAYRRALGGGATPEAAVGEALGTVGRAMMTTSLVLFSSFALMTVSSFPPHQTFGVVIACTMLVALVSDLFVLPALLLRMSPRPATT